MEPKQQMPELERLFKNQLYTYLVAEQRVDEHLPEAPDIEDKWAAIGEAFMPDAIREFNAYPTVVFGWMMYVGMAIAKYWDEDWELYNQVENLYTYLRNRIDFDHMDDYIREKVLFLNQEDSAQLQRIVGNCAEQTDRQIRHMNIEPGTADAFRAVVAALHQMYLFGAAMQLKAMGYHMTKLG